MRTPPHPSGAGNCCRGTKLVSGMCRRMKAEAEERTGRLEEAPDLRAALDALSDNLQELQADIERLRDEAAVIQCGNPRVMQVRAHLSTPASCSFQVDHFHAVALADGCALNG